MQKGAIRYRRELGKLPESYAVALAWDVRALVRVLERAAMRPLLVVGSGGSFSVATYCAALHRRASGRVARALTPLMFASGDIREDCGLLCVSASGSNVDIRAAFEHGAQLELRPTIAFALERDSPIHNLATGYGFPDSVVGPAPAEPDGFLAVNSVLVTSLVFARAYRALCGDAEAFPKSYAEFLRAALPATSPEEISAAVAKLGGSRTLAVLYAPDLEAAAVDLESRFVEAALGHVHCTDYRNFGHGRHNWMDKRRNETAVLSLASSQYVGLADRTLKLLPEEIAAIRVEFGGDSDVAGLGGLVTALHVAAGAGEAIGVDAGRPGIPEFGRKLYRLTPPKPVRELSPVLERKRRAIRAIGGAIADAELRQACEASRARIEDTKIQGVVLDYDGTLCDMRSRFDALPANAEAALLQLLELGLPVGIATGRGQSVGKALREALPKKWWGRIWIGYYNGGECCLLSDDAAPHGREPSPSTMKIAATLSARAASWIIEARSSQVTVTPRGKGGIAELIAEVAAMLGGDAEGVRFVTSSHSVDILLPNVSKTTLVTELGKASGASADHILRIGDRGAAPGNDYDMLRHPLGVSVDEVSPDLDSCWRWTAAGCLGPTAVFAYLAGLHATSQGIRLSLSDVGKKAGHEP